MRARTLAPALTLLFLAAIAAPAAGYEPGTSGLLFLRLGVGELGAKHVCGSGEFFLLTCRLRDGGPCDGEVFLQCFCSGLAQNQGFAHGDGFLLQAEHVLF